MARVKDFKSKFNARKEIVVPFHISLCYNVHASNACITLFSGTMTTKKRCNLLNYKEITVFFS